jgi:HSP20 family molecular chaperone IbpA
MFGLFESAIMDNIYTNAGIWHSTNHPRYEQWQEEDALFIAFALAGYSKESLSIEEDGEYLSVSAIKQEEQKNRKLAGRSFRTKFVNPKGQCDFKKITATYKDGILEIKIPFVQNKCRRQIEIL